MNEVLFGSLAWCYDMFRMDICVFRHLCVELKRYQLMLFLPLVDLHNRHQLHCRPHVFKAYLRFSNSLT